MSTIYLIRHGQASLGKVNYDELSPLGRKQATTLGKHFASLNISPNYLIQGTLERHAQTLNGIVEGHNQGKQGRKSKFDIMTDERWNEFDFEAIIKRYVSQYDIDMKAVSSPGQFFGLLKQALSAWSKNELEGELPETWEDFESRIRSALTNLLAMEHENIFLISSGGAISMAVKHILGLNNQAMIDLNLQSRNSGVTEVISKRGKAYVSCFNHVAHLSTAENRSMITHA